jgi:hypothetical protein
MEFMVGISSTYMAPCFLASVDCSGAVTSWSLAYFVHLLLHLVTYFESFTTLQNAKLNLSFC